VMVSKGKKVYDWVAARALLGLLIWGGLDISHKQWLDLAAQVLFSGYFIYFIKARLTKLSFIISNFVVIPLVIAAMVFNYAQTDKHSKQYIQEITAGFNDFSQDNSQQQQLFAIDTANMTDDQVHKVFAQLLAVSMDKQAKIAALKAKVAQGLEEFS